MSSSAPAPSRATQLLAAWQEGNRSALDELQPLVEGELRRLARRYLRRERPLMAFTLSGSKLVEFGTLEITVTSQGGKRGRILSSRSASVRTPGQVTELLVAWREGNNAALDQLVPLVEAELRQLARRYLRRERPGHVLQATALVNEAFIRLLNWREVNWQNRAHFVAMAARLMRHVLVDASRRRDRGPDRQAVKLADIADADGVVSDRSRDLVAIDDALRALADLDPRKAQIVELRFFGGLSLEEIAEVIGVAPVTVSREWAKARAWLHREIGNGNGRREERVRR